MAPEFYRKWIAKLIHGWINFGTDFFVPRCCWIPSQRAFDAKPEKWPEAGAQLQEFNGSCLATLVMLTRWVDTLDKDDAVKANQILYSLVDFAWPEGDVTWQPSIGEWKPVQALVPASAEDIKVTVTAQKQVLLKPLMQGHKALARAARRQAARFQANVGNILLTSSEVCN